LFALLPVIGGLLLGWLAPRRTAITAQVVLFAVAATMVTLSAPDHGGGYGDVVWIAPGLAIASTATLLLGLRLGGSSPRHQRER